MQSEFLELVKDTLSYIRQEEFFSFPVTMQQKSPAFQKPTEVSSKKPTVGENFILPKKATSNILEKIQKHLPHIEYVESIPSMKQVAIVMFQKEDFPFLKSLAIAIQKHHCPVKILDGEKIDSIKKWDAFQLILTQKKLAKKNAMLLAPISIYQKSSEQKKILWSTICKHLSQK